MTPEDARARLAVATQGIEPPPSVALLGGAAIDWLVRGGAGEPALLWTDLASLVEVLDGRATVLGALLAGAARREQSRPAWEWRRRQATVHEGPDGIVGQIPSGRSVPRKLRGSLLGAIAEVLRDQIRFRDHQDRRHTTLHVRWTGKGGRQQTTIASDGVYAVHDGPIEGVALELGLDEQDLPAVIRRETLLTDLVLTGRVMLGGNVEAVGELPSPQF